MKMINLGIFYIRYHIYTGLKKIFTKKSNKYILIFLGRFPTNLKHGIKPIIDNDHDLRFTFGPASLIIVFNSKVKMKELNITFNKVYSEYSDALFLFDISKNNYGKHCIDIINKNLFIPSELKLSNDEKLSKIQYLIEAIIMMREGFRTGQYTEAEIIPEEELPTTENDQVDMNQIDEIIDKIKDVGYEKLTPQEQNLYNKIFKK